MKIFVHEQLTENICIINFVIKKTYKTLTKISPFLTLGNCQKEKIFNKNAKWVFWVKKIDYYSKKIEIVPVLKLGYLNRTFYYHETFAVPIY